MEPPETIAPTAGGARPADGLDDLKEYERHKFAMAEILREAHATDTRDSAFQGKCRELAARLAEDRFNLVIIGRFNRGKSTLMNALLGKDYLPTGIVPLTSVITTVRYGSQEQVVLHFMGPGMPCKVPLARLPDYVTQRGNPGNEKRIAFAQIELPVELLRRGFFFVDTPGLGSPIVENTLTTERFLPEADAFVLVTSYESPLSEEEDRILDRVRGTGKRIFVVMNKQDTVTARDKEEATNYLEERLRQYRFPHPSQVLSLSARQAMEARLTGNPELLRQSGIESFEAELHQFLMEERARAFLLGMAERVKALLLERLHTVGSGQPAAAEPGPKGLVAADPKVSEKTLHTLMERLDGLRDILGGQTDTVTDKAKEEARETAAFTDGYILDLDKKAGCLVCAAVLSATLKFLSQYQYALTVDPETRRDHAVRRGFCTLHTWQYETISSPYGVCTAYPELTSQLAAQLHAIALKLHNGELPRWNVRSLVSSTATCPVCEVRIAAEKEATAQIADRARHNAGTKHAHAPTLCLPHLAMLADTLGAGEPAARMLEGHAQLLERTAEDLQRYAVKHEGLRRHLASQEEYGASRLALLLLAGHRNVSAPWRIETIL